MKLAHISFSRPIPIPGTHERISEFSVVDGWDLVDDDGRTWLRRPGNPAVGRPALRWWFTYVNGSSMPLDPDAAPPAEEPTRTAPEVFAVSGNPNEVVDDRIVMSNMITVEPKAKKGRKR